MPDLIAQGPDHRNRWRRRLPGGGQSVWLGRECGDWSVGWDPCISRQHVCLEWKPPNTLHVATDANAANPVFYQGQSETEFDVSMGQHFVIGNTTLTLVNHEAQVSQAARLPTSQQTFTADYLRHISFRHAQKQIQALSRLPEIVAGAATDGELHARLVNLLLTGIVEAEAAAVVQTTEQGEPISVLHWDRVDQVDGAFEPSAQLIVEATETGQNVVHIWRDESQPRSESGDTIRNNFDWALCSPIPGTDCRGRAIYVSGYAHADLDEDSLRDAMKFVELIGTTVGSVCDVRRLQRQAAALSHFFSPPVRNAVAAADPEIALAPRETDVSVLFCDLRGFSQRTEESADDLFGLLNRVSESLGIMTHHILSQGGVIGDFHGDAAMGFWGWPLPDSQLVAQACRAALKIQAAFEDAAALDAHALTGFRVGMGLATGRAVAGKIGTVDQVKVTAFGPVVNLASRLEGMTRHFGLPILLDAVTAKRAHQQLKLGEACLRPLCQVRPFGMKATQELHVLEPLNRAPWANDPSYEARYHHARQCFENGDWKTARAEFGELLPDDPVRGFYLRWMRQHGDQPPAEWSGTIHLDRK